MHLLTTEWAYSALPDQLGLAGKEGTLCPSVRTHPHFRPSVSNYSNLGLRSASKANSWLHPYIPIFSYLLLIMLHVKAILVSTMTIHCAATVQMWKESESRIRKWKDMWFKKRAEDGERGAAVTCDGRLFHRRAAETGNALSPTVDRWVRRISRDVDEAERSRRLASVTAGRRSSSHRYVGARPCCHLYAGWNHWAYSPIRRYLKSTSTDMHCRSIRVIARELSVFWRVFWKFRECVVCDVKVWQSWCLERVLEVYNVLWIASDSDYQSGIPA